MASSSRLYTPQQFSTLSSRLSEGRDDRSPFAPAAVLPEQFCDPHSGVHSGIRALMLAILEDALCCLQTQSTARSRRTQRLAREAEEWILSDDHRWPFSFVNICDALGLEPTSLRRRLKQMPLRPQLPVRRKPSHIVVPQRSLKVAA